MCACLLTPTTPCLPAPPFEPCAQDLANATGSNFEKQVLEYINSPATNLLVALTVNLLSTHAQDEHLLDEANTLLTVRAVRGGAACCIVAAA